MKVITIIASVLKPVDDTRMYEKLGISLQQSNKYDVNIIGFYSKSKHQPKEIRFFPVNRFSRLSISRFLAPIRFFRMVWHLKPQLIIVTTHELILFAVLYKLLRRRCRLAYDVQENYYLNVIHNSGLPGGVRYMIAAWIRTKEIFSKYFFSIYFLAEFIYTKEFSFSKEKQIIVLNKYKEIGHPGANADFFKEKSALRIILSGTIHETYGIHQSICLAIELSKYLVIKLLVIGRIANTKLLKHLWGLADHYPWVEIRAATDPIPHHEIIQEIQQSDFGIVSHQPVPSIAGCFPTRIYELMAYQKPILLQNHEPWTTFCTRWDSCIPLNFNDFDAASIAKQMLERKFYRYGQPDDIFWESEEKKLLAGIDSLFF